MEKRATIKDVAKMAGVSISTASLAINGKDGVTEKTKKQVQAKANQQIRQWAKENLPENAQILNKDLNFSYKENIIEVGVTIEVRLQIGIEQELLIGQKDSDQ